MFQLSITVFFGIMALLLSTNNGQSNSALKFTSIGLSIAVMLAFMLALFKVNPLMNWLYKRFSKQQGEAVHLRWTSGLLFRLFSLSLLRYLIFSFQFILLLNIFQIEAQGIYVFSSVCIYFLFTTIIPMFSVIEAAVRAAIALIVFSELGISNASLAVVAILLWLINIVFPSVVGYVVLLRENLSLSSFTFKNRNK